MPCARIVATRMSVIFSCDGSDARRTAFSMVPVADIVLLRFVSVRVKTCCARLWQWPARACSHAPMVVHVVSARTEEERDMDIAKIKRPPKDLVERVREVGAATASATLAHMGIRNCFMAGPVARIARRRWSPGPA